jgi:hypothetical protein
MGKVRIYALHWIMNPDAEKVLKIQGMNRLVSGEETGDKPKLVKSVTEKRGQNYEITFSSIYTLFLSSQSTQFLRIKACFVTAMDP